jgi:hypothetical protein
MNAQYGVGEMYVRNDNIATEQRPARISRTLVNEHASWEEGCISGIWKMPTTLRKSAIP